MCHEGITKIHEARKPSVLDGFPNYTHEKLNCYFLGAGFDSSVYKNLMVQSWLCNVWRLFRNGALTKHLRVKSNFTYF
jgi:hypothetical protein